MITITLTEQDAIDYLNDHRDIVSNAPIEQDDDGPFITDVDTRGYPWDERIHASSKALNTDGSWRYRRGVEKETINAVEMELKGFSEPTTPVVVPAVPPVVEAVNGMPIAPAPAPAATELPDVSSMTFVQLMQKLTPLTATGKITPDMIAGAMASVGLVKLMDLTTRPELVPQVAVMLGAI